MRIMATNVRTMMKSMQTMSSMKMGNPTTMISTKFRFQVLKTTTMQMKIPRVVERGVFWTTPSGMTGATLPHPRTLAHHHPKIRTVRIQVVTLPEIELENLAPKCYG